MRVALFSVNNVEKDFLIKANKRFNHDLVFFDNNLNNKTASLANGFEAISIFVSDILKKDTLEYLAKNGVKLIALRSAGFNHVDLKVATELNIKVVRVPAYSPYAIAEHTVALILSLNRRIHKSYARVRENNFSLDGLLGFDLHEKTVGIIGTGKIGSIVAKILKGFGCNLLGHDLIQNKSCLELGLKYISLEELFTKSQIITIHCPLLPETYHLINENSISKMNNGVMIINTSRGGVIDTQAVIKGLKSGKIGNLGLDVYEEEENIFFKNLSSSVIQDDIFSRLVTFPNVLITGHQAFFTKEALENITQTTLENISDFENVIENSNEVKYMST